MKTKLNATPHRTNGMTRTGVLVALVVLVAVSVVALLGSKLRGQQQPSDVPQPAQQVSTSGPEIYQDPSHNFTLDLPADWTVSASPAQGPSAMTLISFERPNGTGYSSLCVWKHPSSSNPSARNWAEQEVAAGIRMGKKDGTVRPNSWSDLTVAGRPATSVITDFAEGPARFVIYHVYAMTDSSSMKFRFMLPAQEFADLKPAVDVMLASCKLD